MLQVASIISFYCKLLKCIGYPFQYWSGLVVGGFEEWKVRLSQSPVRLASGGWAWQKQPEAELSQDQV